MAPPGISSSSEENPNFLQSKNIVVLDGGFATQLSCHVSQPIDGDVLWSARFLASDPEAVIDTHIDFLRAGADLIITNTYQASIGLFVKHLNLTEEEAYALIKKSVELAHTAVERYLQEFPDAKKPLIVGSVGPYGASLHDGSEYTGAYASSTPVETMKAWHVPRIDALIEGGVDLLAIETIPCRAEAEMLVNLLKDKYPQTKAWLAFSVAQDGKSTAFGEPFQETARACYDLNPDQLVAVGVNCTAPRLIESLVDGINVGRSTPIPIVVYPNSGESYNVEMGFTKTDCAPLSSYVAKWLDMGVKGIGGCCRTGAEDIKAIKREVEKWRIQNNVSEV
uniref:Hcy-binding domain-containing protein n=1 Tax=Dendroctonus ponderosae TaxID=77166 RepID=A0AAR5Q3K4_DENPD